ncbi:5-hydroxytryptamine receptor 1F isoform X2 [Alosa sapidissima]|uniref:5-hydroxytryptamine receptor 1F isoform X2 n=1 Tax=Alosa sapidissima TaxID=34773 RepID=UPI001C09D1DD|nr:5-hydroxytryptamine receptor 1F isoform X2 [Alosa sapidissima]
MKRRPLTVSRPPLLMDPALSSPEQLRSSDPQTTFDLSKVLLAVALSVLAVAAAGVNALVITSILATRKLRSPANFLICSLALTDLLVSVLVMPVSIVSLTADGRWHLGAALCNLWLGMDVVCCTCSILHLAAIALDRYRAITDAVAYAQKRTARHALLTVAAVWLLSVLVSLPPLVWRRQDTADTLDEDGPTQCVIEHDHVAFTVYSTFGAFYVPLFLILVLYYRIYRAAQTLQDRRGSRRPCLTVSSAVLPGEGSGSGALSPVTLSPTERSFSEPSNEGERACMAGPWCAPPLRPPCRPPGVARERRAALTLGLILGAFVVCWLPFFLKEVIVNSCPSCHTPAALADGLTWLGYLNSLMNPLIYTIFNQDFKKAFKRLLAVRCTHHR